MERRFGGLRFRAACRSRVRLASMCEHFIARTHALMEHLYRQVGAFELKDSGTLNSNNDVGAPIGVLMSNLGSPERPDPAAVRDFLAEFLSDPRVVDQPRWLWWLVLHGIILRVRPARVAKAYQSVWTEEGSPLLAISRRQQSALEKSLADCSSQPVKVVLGMRYGKPSIAAALESLRKLKVRKLLVLPMYPQYSATTTATVFDALFDELRKWRHVPELRLIQQYHDDSSYIAALAASVNAHWETHGRADRLLLSFHGLPTRYVTAGDPYYQECQRTARLLADKLHLDSSQWLLAFQSRFGREEWLKPYTDHTLREWARQGVRRVQVLCPGFSADCLETLEEIAEQNKTLFLSEGGETFEYIPALNDDPAHVDTLTGLVMRHMDGWVSANVNRDDSRCGTERVRRAGVAGPLEN